MDRIEVIERSLRCFTYGLIGLLPGLGAPFAAIAIVNHFRVSGRCGGQWNPARRYLAWGLVAALAGLSATLALTAIIALAIALPPTGSSG